MPIDPAEPNPATAKIFSLPDLYELFINHLLHLYERRSKLATLWKQPMKVLVPTEEGEKRRMPDLMFIALTIVFFLLSAAYVRGCDKL